MQLLTFSYIDIILIHQLSQQIEQHNNIHDTATNPHILFGGRIPLLKLIPKLDLLDFGPEHLLLYQKRWFSDVQTGFIEDVTQDPDTVLLQF